MRQAEEPLKSTLEATAAGKQLIPIKEPLRTILLWAIAGLLFVGAAVGFTFVPSKHDIGVNYHEVQEGLDHPDKR